LARARICGIVRSPVSVYVAEAGTVNSELTLFHAGERLRLVIAGRWLAPLNPITGSFPAAYKTRNQGDLSLHWAPSSKRISSFQSSRVTEAAGTNVQSAAWRYHRSVVVSSARSRRW
jgi:hypothetical protein